MHGVAVKAVDCPAIDGIIEEADETTGEVADSAVLAKTLEEEKATDKKLTSIAETKVNLRAASGRGCAPDRPAERRASSAAFSIQRMAKTRLARRGLASVEITPIPITGRALPRKPQM